MWLYVFKPKISEDTHEKKHGNLDFIVKSEKTNSDLSKTERTHRECT